MKKYSNPSQEPSLCKGNLTRSKHADQLHGAYQYQAITPNPQDGRTAPDGSIPLDQVIDAKEFIEENKKVISQIKKLCHCWHSFYFDFYSTESWFTAS